MVKTPDDLRRLFVLTFVAGLIASVPSAIFSGGVLDGLAFVVSLLGMLTYGFLGYKVAEELGLRDQFADSIYYLGFLFTLVALALALVALGNDTKIDVDKFVFRFGLALSTTALGLLSRVYLSNFQIEPEENIKEVAKKLQEASAQLTHHVNDASVNIQSAHMNFENTMKEYVKTAEKSVQDSATTMRESISTAGKDFVAVTRKHIQGNDKILKSIVGKFEKSSNTLFTSLEPTSDALAKAVTRLEETAKRQAQLEGQISLAVEQIQKHWTAESNSSGAAASALQEIRESTERELATIKRHKQELLQNVEASREAVLQVQNQLVQSVTHLQKELGGS